MKKTNAFTLAEVLMVLVILGFLAIISINVTTNSGFDEKTFQASAYKIVKEFQSASIKIRESYPDKIPTGSFTTNTMNTKDYAIYNATEQLANTTQVMDLYATFLRLDRTNKNFCSMTKAFSTDYCKNNNTAIQGAKISGDIYVGLEVIADTSTGALASCPQYYRVNPVEKATTTEKCWGRLYLDANGTKAPNEFGKDAFVFGLGEFGVIY